MKLIVRNTDFVADGVRRLHLASADGCPLPPCTAGAHLKVTLPTDAGGVTREYSIIGRTAPDDCYEVAVLLDPESRGGSRAMHALAVGDLLDAQGPFNEFALSGGATSWVLIAGGIGITPILSMARELRAAGRPFELHYGAKSRGRMAFHDEVMTLPGAIVYCGEEGAAARIPVAAVLAEPAPGRHVHVCGPRSLIADVVDTARRLGWQEDQVHFEAFNGAVALDGDKPIRVELRASGRTILVQAQESILDAMLAAGMDPLYDCRRGECGMCITGVIEGVPEHRDHALTDGEKTSGKVICTCVSRARGTGLVLDL
ncbi:PDR/VanB family oxidoreductase [Pseudacidovorax intermedius]|uniref:PDR/VanB family oxidoreductase n=1 Tax=Pseudacidovorax intermedius TaxID=433924 RepID=UPI0026EA4F1E|nr:PDR/VanB family oxidoreductase [Pseudacidovorax intermedius]